MLGFPQLLAYRRIKNMVNPMGKESGNIAVNFNAINYPQ
jgi:hypothetical protein